MKAKLAIKIYHTKLVELINKAYHILLNESSFSFNLRLLRFTVWNKVNIRPYINCVGIKIININDATSLQLMIIIDEFPIIC